MKASLIFLITFAVFIFGPVLKATAAVDWIFYWDGSYHGKVIDAETKEPIEVAVVVAVYRVSCYRIIQTSTKEVGAQEVLTQADGTFRIPSFWTLTTPDCLPKFTRFMAFKLWYGPFPVGAPGGPYPKAYSQQNPDLKEYKTQTELQGFFRTGVIIELLPLKTKEELLRHRPSYPTVWYDNRLPNYLKYDDEWGKLVGHMRVPGE